MPQTSRKRKSRKSKSPKKKQEKKKARTVVSYKSSFEHELKPSAARDGGKIGDILVGCIRGNFGFAVELLEEIKPIARRGHLARVAERAITSPNEIPVSEWKQEAAKHMDWPISHPQEHTISDNDFILAVSIVLEASSSVSSVALDLRHFYKLSKSLSQAEKDALGERLQIIDYSLAHHSLPHHACIVETRFRIVDPGSGEKSSLFRSMMEESQLSPNGIQFDDLSQCIQRETGSNDATFFLNYDNMIHPNGGIYKYEDEDAKEYRLKSNITSFLKADQNFFKRIRNKEDIVYILHVNPPKGKSHVPSITCEFCELHNYSQALPKQEWNFPSLPNVRFLLDYNIPSENKWESVVPTASSTSNLKLTAGILKSLIQKQIRRGLAREAVIAAATLKDMKASYNPQFHTSTTGAAALLQRIVIILIEDVGYSQRLSPLCWLAHVAAYDNRFIIPSPIWSYVWDVIYQMTKRKKHEFFHGPSCKIETEEVKDYSTLFEDYPGLSSEQYALAFGLELRCREPGMAGDRIMLRRAIYITLVSDRKPNSEEVIQEDTPTELLLGLESWDDKFLLTLPEAVDFHAYPAIVDRIFEWDVEIYSHYFTKASAQRKMTSVELLRNDIWNYSSCINFRDPRPKVPAYWKKTVEPVYHKIIFARLNNLIH